VVGDGLDAVGRGLEDGERAGLGVGALALGDDRAHAVARDGAGNEDDVAVVACDAVASEGEAVDAQVELLPLGGAR
jgi:hypothetical protein